MLRALFVAAVLLAAPLAAAKPHPDVARGGDPDACLSCHREKTPQVVQAWESGPHGLMLVKCFVCHGSTGKDFASLPDERRCQGCHADKVFTVVPVKGPQRGKQVPAECRTCHDGHTLAVRGKPTQNPHLPR
jgi:hypothetical protein